jgi:hypothetical protein
VIVENIVGLVKGLQNQDQIVNDSDSHGKKRDINGDELQEIPLEPALRKGLELVREKGNENVFKYLLKNCYGATLQKHVWMRGLRTRKLQDVITSYDEAIVLLTIENNIAMWEEMRKKNVLKPSEVDVRPLYTVSRGKGVGWSKLGIARFNVLLHTIEAQRLSGNMAKEEKEFTETYANTKYYNDGRLIAKKTGDDELLSADVVAKFELPKKVVVDPDSIND